MARASAAFGRASRRLFAHLGDEAVLSGYPVLVRVVISRNVELIGDDGLVDRVVTTATLPEECSPRAGDTLTVGADVWTLDAPLRSDADVPEWVLLPA